MLQVGQTALVRVKASEPDGAVPREGSAVAEFWAPGRDPEHDPAARGRPDHVVECFFDEKLRAWTAAVSTEGWQAGTWTVRGRAACTGRHGPLKGWGWQDMPLSA